MLRAKEKLKNVLINTLRKTKKVLCLQGKERMLQKMEYSDRKKLLSKIKTDPPQNATYYY